MDCFLSFFNILDHIYTTCFIFANCFGKSFQSLSANSQRNMNKISRSIFKIWNFSPPVSNAFPLTKTKLPLDEIFLLTFNRVLSFRYLLKNLWHHISIWNIDTNWKLYFKKIEIGGGAVLLLWANISPPLALITKNRVVWEPFSLSMVQVDMSEDYTKLRVVRSDGEG
jgi:hypothetical protein